MMYRNGAEQRMCIEGLRTRTGLVHKGGLRVKHERAQWGEAQDMHVAFAWGADDGTTAKR